MFNSIFETIRMAISDLLVGQIVELIKGLLGGVLG